MTTKTKDSKYLARDIKATPVEIIKGLGNYLIDAKGVKYLDFTMGWCVGNIGWGNKDIEKRIKNYKGPNYVSPDFLYKPWAELANRLADITPNNLTKSFRATGGTEAVEIAIQAAMSHTKRSKFVSLNNSYHGHSIGAMSLGFDEFRKWYKNLLPSCYKISAPLDKRAGEKVESILKNGDVAAYISEPVVCNMGVEIPTQEYFDIVQRACKKYKTVLIVDEVATGFGRTGKMFACEHYNLKPDVICLAKGLTGGYGSLGAVVTTEEVAKSMAFEFSFYSTFGWHPLSVEATLANLDYWDKYGNNILSNVNKVSEIFKNHLSSVKFKSKCKVNIKGLAIGIKFDDKNYSYKFAENALKNKLLISPLDEYTVMIFPALNIDKKTIYKGLELLTKSV